MFLSLICSFAMAATFKFKNADVTEVIAQYSEMSKKKIIFGSEVRGKITILNPNSVSVEEAFNDLSQALSKLGFAIVEHPGTGELSVISARDAERSSIDVVTTLPSAQPERMLTYVRTLKHVTSDEINSKIRILSSKDGEMVPFKNKLLFTDWVSNLYRIEKVLAELDVAK